MSISRSSSYQRLPSLQLADAADEELGLQATIGSPAKGHAPQLYTAPSLARPPLPPVSRLDTSSIGACAVTATFSRA